MSVSSQYLQASFRGVNFLIKGESEEGGKKTVTHEYANSNRRYVEELGTLPSTFSMQAFVHGAAAVEESRNLKRVLDLPGVGILIHPIYGRLEVKSTKWNRSTQESEMGEITFDLEFARSDSVVSLTPGLSTSSAVSASADAARLSGFNALSGALVIQKSRYALLQTQRVTSAVLRAINSGTKSVTGSDSGALAVFDKAFQASTRNLYQAVLAGADLADSLKSVYEASRATASPAQQIVVWKTLAEYEQTRPLSFTDTKDRYAAEMNAQIINGHTRINALINLYESVSFSSFNTDEELQAARNGLDDLFNGVFGSSLGNPLADNNELRQTVLDLRSVTNASLDNLSENVFNIESVSPGETSLALLSYQYYGNLDNIETLRQLNPNVNHAEVLISDVLKVLA